MAVAKISCGACGAPLEGGSAVCGKCGEKVELPAGLAGTDAPSLPQTCPVCGHTNSPAGRYCESCGATLGRAPAPKRAAAAPRPAGRRIEGWKLATGGAVVVLVALFGYLEWSRTPATTGGEVQQAQPSQTGSMEPPMEEVRRLRDAVRANPGSADDLLRLANRLHDMGLQAPSLLPEAIDTYGKYLRLKPADPNARVDLGICYFELGRTDSLQSGELFRSSVREMETAIRSAPTHQPAAFNLGVVTLFMGDTEASTKWFRKTIELGPETELGRRAKNLLAQHAFPSSAR
jgi:cytochrome c-type biogenesis protein CcmH/NrfG